MTVIHSDSHALTTYSEDISTSKSIAFTLDVPLHHPPPLVEIRAQASALACSPKVGAGRTLFLTPLAPGSYPIPMAHRVTPGHPEVVGLANKIF